MKQAGIDNQPAVGRIGATFCAVGIESGMPDFMIEIGHTDPVVRYSQADHPLLRSSASMRICDQVSNSS